MMKNFAISIIQTLRQQGFQAYLVGGCVRDLLLGRDPKDYDISTDATPQQVMNIFPETYAVGAQFGVVLIPLPQADADALSPDSRAVEVATFRKDVGYSDGRHPDEVRFSRDPQEDVARRDFTINGMMLDPVGGEVLDFVGGRADLAAGIIRAIGNAETRFAEDKLRMLRAVRFAARFEYSIEPATFEAIRKLAAEIVVVSHERVRDELSLMLTEGHGRRAFQLLDESGLLAQVLPEITRMK
jgi:poly(A) polymerase